MIRLRTNYPKDEEVSMYRAQGTPEVCLASKNRSISLIKAINFLGSFSCAANSHGSIQLSFLSQTITALRAHESNLYHICLNRSVRKAELTLLKNHPDCQLTATPPLQQTL